MKNQRSLLLFEQSIRSKWTLRNYRKSLARFMDFHKIKDFDSLLEIPSDDLQVMIEDYVIDLKKVVNPNSVSTLMLGIRRFFVMNRIRIDWEIIKNMYPDKVKSSGFKPFTNEHIRRMLDSTSSKRNKAIIHFLASTGSRIGVFDFDLSMKHLKNMDYGCKAVLLYADDIDEYWAFLTPEASKVLGECFEKREKDGEKLTPDSPIFRRRYSLGFEKALPVKLNSVQSALFRIIQNSGIDRHRINKNYDIQMSHGFRKRFNTILKLDNDINSNIAEKILGHSVTHKLDNTYFKPELDDLFKEFKKAVPKLTIDESLIQKEQLKQKEQEIEKLESDKDKRITNLEYYVAELAKRLDSKIDA